MRSLPPQLSFADLELQFQGVQLDPLLRTIAEFLDQHLTLLEQVRKDLERGLKNARTGRNGIAPSQVLRSLVLMRVKNWDYRELQERINDGFTLRSFTAFDSQPVPKQDAFNRAFNRLTPETLRDINQLVVQAAVQLGLEDGKTLRVDTTVVESNIHYPTDATLLWDSVRTITRLIADLHEKLPDGVQGFTNRTRSARRRMQAIQRMTAQQRSQQQEPKYRELIGITEQVVTNARQVVEKAKAAVAGAGDLIASLSIDSLRNEIAGYCQLTERVIDQSRRRVLQGEQVPTEEKIYSIFEPHTDLIKRGKAQKPVEFGHKVFLAESAQGLSPTIKCWMAILSTPTTSHPHWIVTSKPSASRRICTRPIAASSAPRMYNPAKRAESPKSPFRSAEDTRRPSRTHWNAVKNSRRANDSAPALRAASRCCSASAG